MQTNAKPLTVRPKVLCVEDNYDECDLVTAALDEFEVVCVPTIAEARAMLGQETFSLLLIDEHLPDGSGMSFCSELQRSKVDSPILIVSGDLFITCGEALKAGAVAFIPKSKPSFVDELQRLAGQSVRRAHA